MEWKKAVDESEPAVSKREVEQIVRETVRDSYLCIAQH